MSAVTAAIACVVAGQRTLPGTSFSGLIKQRILDYCYRLACNLACTKKPEERKMQRIKQFIAEYVFSEDLSLNARIVNMICLVGMGVTLVATLVRIFMSSGTVLILVMFGVFLFIACLMFICNRFHMYALGTWVILFVLCDVLFPVMFFILGGANGAIPAYFILSVVLIFFFLEGKALGLFLAAHIILIILCHYIGYKFPHMLRHLTFVNKYYTNIESILIPGLFIGMVILFQRRIYKLEKMKVEISKETLGQHEKHLRMVNNAAVVLLSSDPEQFERIIERSMKMIIRNLDVDRINIWKNRLEKDEMFYVKVYSWNKEGGFMTSRPGEKTEYAYRDGLRRWKWFLAAGNNINCPLTELPADEQEMLATQGIASILVIPVFMVNKFWGFISFEMLEKKRRFSPNEVDILRSTGLLFANAVVRNEEIQNLVQAREEALSGISAKSEFLASMSHEIRSLLNAIMGMTSIAKTSEDTERKDSCLVKIEEASYELLGVINDVFDITEIEAKKFELSQESFDFEKTIQKVVNVINFRTEEKKQSFFVHIDRDIPKFLIGDDKRLAQVVTNLLGNAVKFTPEGGTIQLNTRLLKEENGLCTIQVEIIDSGIGLSPEQQSRLFTSIGHASSNSFRKPGGSGLGLAISKPLIELMGGNICIESEPGKGSTFAFTIEAKKDMEVQERPSVIGINWAALRILAVDDDHYTREYFRNLARQFGIACDVASSGEEALSLIEENGSYDIYFVDWNMPGMNGIELSRKIKEHTALKPAGAPKSLVTMITASDWGSIEGEAREAGVSKFLTKPLFPSSIVECISQCLWMNKVPEAEKAPVEVEEGEANFAGHRILLVDDVEINLEIVQALLEPTGLILEYAVNGHEAVKRFTESPGLYDAIFMDIQMPEMDGFEATRKIRDIEAERGAGRIPIIAMTASVFREDIEKCLAAGMDSHIGKPLDFEEVLSKLRVFLQAG